MCLVIQNTIPLLEKERESECDACSTYFQAVASGFHILLSVLVINVVLVTNGIVVLGPPVKVGLVL